MSKKSLKHSTIKRKVKALKSLLKNHVSLASPDEVVTFLNNASWTNGTKDIVSNAYKDYLDSIGLTSIKLPEFRVEDTLPFIPLEKEIDSIISSVRPKTHVFLRILKETAVRPIEAWRLRWADLDIPSRTLNISPAKYSNARKMKTTEQTLNLLLSLPRKNQYVLSARA